MAGLYTFEELKTKIIELDVLLDEALTGSSLDTTQSKHDIKQSVRQQERQKIYYMNLLRQCYPSEYRAMFPNEVIRFNKKSCHDNRGFTNVNKI